MKNQQTIVQLALQHSKNVTWLRHARRTLNLYRRQNDDYKVTQSRRIIADVLAFSRETLEKLRGVAS